MTSPSPPGVRDEGSAEGQECCRGEGAGDDKPGRVGPGTEGGGGREDGSADANKGGEIGRTGGWWSTEGRRELVGVDEEATLVGDAFAPSVGRRDGGGRLNMYASGQEEHATLDIGMS